MAIVVWPLDAVSGAPSYTGEMLRQTTNAWALPGPSSRPVGARTGLLTTPALAVSGTGWSVGLHQGVLDLETSTTAGAYVYVVNTSQIGTVNAADPTFPRVDILYVQLSDPAEGDGTTTPQAQVLYLAGTAASTPSAPTLPARSMLLATINMPASGTGSPSITNSAPYTAAKGGVLYARNSGEYPSAPATGQLVWDVSLSAFVYYSGSAWLPLIPRAQSWTPTFTGLAVNNGILVASYQRTGSSVDVAVELVFGSTTSISGGVTMTLPVAAAATQDLGCSIYSNAGANRQVGFAQIQGGGTTVQLFMPSSTTSALMSQVGTFQATFGTNSSIKVYGTYLTA